MSVSATSFKGGILVSALGVFGSAFLWLLGFKVIAIWLGPEGVGLFSQLRQIVQAATIGATFGGTNSVVQGLSERDDLHDRLAFRAMASRLVGLFGTLVAISIFIAAPLLTLLFFSSADPLLIAALRWMALAVLLSVGATYATAVLNGYRTYGYMATAQIAGTAALVVALIILWLLRMPLDARLLAGSFIACFGITCAIGIMGVMRLPVPLKTVLKKALSGEQSRAFMWFALSNLVAALSLTGTLLIIRSWIIESRGLAFAGLFDAGWTLTFNYTTLFLTACSVIYLPLLTAATNSINQKTCMLKTAYLVFGASLLICFSMVLSKEFLINLLYSSQFQDSGRLLMVLVIAVVFRGVSWVYGTLIVATRNSRVLLISDVAQNLLLLAAARYALDRHASLEALSWAFVLSHFCYLVFVVEYAGYKNKLLQRRLIWPFLMMGTLPLFYLVLGSEWVNQAYLEPIKWFCVFIGLTVGITALLAGKKIKL
jgi:O-antigen/teichoic acid export membrane protein